MTVRSKIELSAFGYIRKHFVARCINVLAHIDRLAEPARCILIGAVKVNATCSASTV